MHVSHLDTTIPTYARGQKRIDYIFATANILPYVTQGGILPFHFLTHTDHRALYIEIDLQRYLRNHLPQPTSTIGRALISTHPRGVHTYNTQLTQWLNTTTIEHDLQTLYNNPSELTTLQKDKLNTLDQEFQSARLNAKRGLQKYSRHPWSPRYKRVIEIVS